MLGKKSENKKNNVQIDSSALSEDQQKCTKYVSSPWPPLEAALSTFNVSLFRRVRKIA